MVHPCRGTPMAHPSWHTTHGRGPWPISSMRFLGFILSRERLGITPQCIHRGCSDRWSVQKLREELQFSQKACPAGLKPGPDGTFSLYRSTLVHRGACKSLSPLQALSSLSERVSEHMH